MTSPRVLFVGGAKESWQMRGRQIAEAIGARATVRPQPVDWRWADVIVLVKRAVEIHGQAAADTGAPIIWDALDFWMQPRDNGQALDFHANLFRQMVPHRVSLVIGATQRMAADLGGMYLPHHCRIGLAPTSPRNRAQVVAYDGSPRYLGRWFSALSASAELLGMRFVVNPSDLSKADVLVSFRDEEWDGWACRHWKSGVKYVNAIAAGRPVVTQPSAAFSELRPVGHVVDSIPELTDALRLACRREMRDRAFEEGRARAQDFTVEAVAEQYRGLLRRVSEGRAA